jgi:hypothetical protein
MVIAKMFVRPNVSPEASALAFHLVASALRFAKLACLQNVLKKKEDMY